VALWRSGWSPGSHPAGKVNAYALLTLDRMHLPATGYRSKNWDEFAKPGAPEMDFVLTVCDKAAGEVCPVWPGQPMTAHWGIADPAAASGTHDEQMRAFNTAFRELDARIKIFTSLRFDSLDRRALKRELDDIGRMRDEPGVIEPPITQE